MPSNNNTVRVLMKLAWNAGSGKVRTGALWAASTGKFGGYTAFVCQKGKPSLFLLASVSNNKLSSQLT
jgi:hypothetical protein